MAMNKPGTSELFAEVGKVGLKHFSGVISEEFLPDLKGDKALKKYREMIDNEPIIAAMMFAVKNLMAQAEVRVEAAGTSPQDQEAADLVQEAFDGLDTTWAETLSDALIMLPFGYSIAEIVYKRTERKRISWQSWAVRSPESRDRWVFDPQTDRVVGWTQRPAPTYETITIPAEKYLHWKTDHARGNPEGTSILRAAYRPYYYSNRLQVIEAIGIERDLTGMPVAWVPQHITNPQNANDTTTLNAFKDLVRDIRADEQGGAVMPLAYDDRGNKLYDLTLMSSPGSKQIDTTPVLDRYAQRMACTILADFIFLGHTGTGSYSLASTRTELFALAVSGWLDNILETINRQAVPRLMALNGMRAENAPALTHGDVETPDLAQLGAYVQQLAGAGMPLFPNPELESALLSAAQLPQGEALSETGDTEVGKRDELESMREEMAEWRKAMAKLTR